MVTLDSSLLNKVNKPGRYTGNEVNCIHKEHSQADARIVLALPDVYEVGMSNLGLKILYEILNNRHAVLAERVYAPWVDMETEMRKNNIPLFTLETFTPITEFDLIGFSLQYELSYSNVLNMLDLAGIPLLRDARPEESPFIVGGGPCAFNPEPVADFFDFFILGEGEEVITEITDILIQWKKDQKKGGKQGYLKQIAAINGVYIPGFYDVSYHPDGTIHSISPNCPEAAPLITKRMIKNLDAVPFATSPVVPYIDIVHNRIMLELFRGCTRGCRFCQAGILYRPVRERKPETLLQLAKELVKNTGYNEISLTSLSSADYSCLQKIIEDLQTELNEKEISVSLPSLRVDSFSIDLAKKVQQVRKSGLTFAPEAGSQRLRNVINKGITEKNLEETISAAFKSGWTTVKLYFMIGLPTETEEDIAEIAALANHMLHLYRDIKGRKGAKLTVSVSSFVPKPHTAFQWFGQNSIEEIETKQKYLRSLFTSRDISFNWHDARTSFLEAAFSRGDRKLSQVILHAWQNGAKFDGWSEFFHFDIWLQAFSHWGINPHFYASRERRFDEILPWDHLSSGVDKSFLTAEYKKAINEQYTPDCRRNQCSACGVCRKLDSSVVDWGRNR